MDSEAWNLKKEDVLRRTCGLKLIDSDSWIVHAWSLKNKKVVRIGLKDCPRMELLKKEVFQIRLVDPFDFSKHYLEARQIFIKDSIP